MSVHLDEVNKNEVVSFKDITFVREGKKILDGVNWEINKGERWCLLGLNGSGKSTLLNMLPAYTFPTRGEMRVFQKTFGNYVWPKIREQIGIVSSSFKKFNNVLERQTPLEIIISGKFASIGIYNSISIEDEIKAEKLMEAFSIEYLSGKKYKNFSQGEQAKVLLARAFMNEPNLLILDEPCQGLDLSSREFFLESLGEIMRTKETPLIYVTHDINEIISEITHVAILGNDGKMMAVGTKQEVLTSGNLSKLYDLNIDIHWEDERPWIKIKNK